MEDKHEKGKHLQQAVSEGHREDAPPQWRKPLTF
jgi:hypothetical protein